MLSAPFARVGWPLDRMRVTQGFWAEHKAADFAAAIGTPAKAPHAGVVVDVTRGGNCGIGVAVQRGSRRFRQCHFSAVYVNVGDTVRKGQVVGLTGVTGNVTGPHLHEAHGVRCSPWPGDCDLVSPMTDIIKSQAAAWVGIGVAAAALGLLARHLLR